MAMSKSTFNEKPSIRLEADPKVLIIETSYTSHNHPDIQWLFNNERVIDNEKNRIRVKSGKATLKIKNPTAESSGKYTCVLTDKHGTKIQQNIQVTLRRERSPESPVFIDEPSEEWLDEGKKLLLKFTIKSVDKPTITWMRHDHKIEPTDRTTMGVKNDEEGIYKLALEIQDPGDDDLGEFKCTVQNRAGQLLAVFNIEGEESEATPKFTRKPLITENRNDGEYFTTIDVAFRTEDDPIITWFDPKNNILLDNPRMKISLKKHEENHNEYSAILELHNYQPSDNGIFTCQIQNKTSKERSIAELFIQIES